MLLNHHTSLTKEQQEFLDKSISFSWYLQEQTKLKLQFFKKNNSKISSTLLLAEILDRSKLGEHPLSKEKYPPVKDGSKWANNLTLVELDEFWVGKFIKYENTFYKSFKTWEEFGVHFTDTLVFHKGILDRFLFDNYLSGMYNSERKLLIETYALGEFEIELEGTGI